MSRAIKVRNRDLDVIDIPRASPALQQKKLHRTERTRSNRSNVHQIQAMELDDLDEEAKEVSRNEKKKENIIKTNIKTKAQVKTETQTQTKRKSNLKSELSSAKSKIKLKASKKHVTEQKIECSDSEDESHPIAIQIADLEEKLSSRVASEEPFAYTIGQMMWAFGDESEFNLSAALMIQDNLQEWVTHLTRVDLSAATTTDDIVAELTQRYPVQVQIFQNLKRLWDAKSNTPDKLSEKDSKHELSESWDPWILDHRNALLKTPQLSLQIKYGRIQIQPLRRLENQANRTELFKDDQEYVLARRASFIMPSPQLMLFQKWVNVSTEEMKNPYILQLLGFLAWDRVGMIIELILAYRRKKQLSTSRCGLSWTAKPVIQLLEVARAIELLMNHQGESFKGWKMPGKQKGKKKSKSQSKKKRKAIEHEETTGKKKQKVSSQADEGQPIKLPRRTYSITEAAELKAFAESCNWKNPKQSPELTKLSIKLDLPIQKIKAWICRNRKTHGAREPKKPPPGKRKSSDTDLKQNPLKKAAIEHTSSFSSSSSSSSSSSTTSLNQAAPKNVEKKETKKLRYKKVAKVSIDDLNEEQTTEAKTSKRGINIGRFTKKQKEQMVALAQTGDWILNEMENVTDTCENIGITYDRFSRWVTRNKPKEKEKSAAVLSPKSSDLISKFLTVLNRTDSEGESTQTDLDESSESVQAESSESSEPVYSGFTDADADAANILSSVLFTHDKSHKENQEEKTEQDSIDPDPEIEYAFDLCLNPATATPVKMATSIVAEQNSSSSDTNNTYRKSRPRKKADNKTKKKASLATPQKEKMARNSSNHNTTTTSRRAMKLVAAALSPEKSLKAVVVSPEKAQLRAKRREKQKRKVKRGKT